MKKMTKESQDKTKRGYTVYLENRVIKKLEEVAGKPDTDRSPSWLINSILKEKLGIAP